MNLQFEGNSLFFHKEDYDKYIVANSLWLNISLRDSLPVYKYLKDSTEKMSMIAVREYNKKYVRIIGTFDMNEHGHMALRPAGLTDILSITPLRFFKH